MRLIAACVLLASCAWSQSNPAWKRPFAPHKIVGNVFYVGTEDLACFLIATPAGHILINTGLADSTASIRAGIEKVGYKIEDIRILLNMQAHFDHVAAMAEIRKLSGAKVYATEADAPVLEDGGKSDPWLGSEYHFAPVKVDRKLKDGDTISLGGTELKVVLSAGHTKGSVSYTLNVEGKSVAIVNVGTVVMPLKGNPKYPNIVSDYEATFARQKQLTPDIWVAAHASQYRMQDKLKAGSFVDPQGYRKAILEAERNFRATLTKQ